MGRIKDILGKMWGYLVKHKVIAILVAVVAVIIIGVVLSGMRRRAVAAGSFETIAAERGSLTASIGATGTVRSNQTAILSWQTTGTIGVIHVAPGDRVQAGDVLAELSTTSLPQSVILAQADLVAAQRNLDNVLYSNSARAQAQLNLANAQKNYNSTKANYGYQTTQRADQATIDNAKAQYILANQQVDLLQRFYNDTADLEDDNPVRANAYSNLYDAIKARDRALAQYNWYIGKPTEQDLNELNGKLAVAQAQLEDAQREWDRMKDGPDPDDVAAAQARVDATLVTIRSAQLSAPFGGTVTEVSGLVGDQVAPGTRGFRIDDLSHMLVDVQVSEVDINTVQVGQPVTLSFDAILAQEYHGKVVQVAQAGDIVQGAVNFNVVVELTDADELVKPGMTAAVTVITQQLENVLLVPNRAVRLVDNQRVVFVLRSGQVQEVKISLGANSDTESEVLGGDLKAGDLIILNPPANLTRPGGGGPGFFGG
jgi:HlyD family secretion protein